MKAWEMANWIEAFVGRSVGGVTFVELQRFLGRRALGTRIIGIEKYNLLLWVASSDVFVEAVNICREERRIGLRRTSFLRYMRHLGFKLPPFPVVPGSWNADEAFDRPHWLPVLLVRGESYSKERAMSVRPSLRRTLDRAALNGAQIGSSSQVQQCYDVGVGSRGLMVPAPSVRPLTGDERALKTKSALVAFFVGV